MQTVQYTGPDAVPAVQALGLDVTVADDGSAYIGWPKPPEAEFAVVQQVEQGQWVILRADVNSFEIFDNAADFADLTDTNFAKQAEEPQS